MNIKFVPQDKNHPADKSVLTNVGEFRPGQVLSMQPWQETEAKRLIENGDFVEALDAPTPATEATPAPEVAEQPELEPEQQITDNKKKK